MTGLVGNRYKWTKTTLWCPRCGCFDVWTCDYEEHNAGQLHYCTCCQHNFCHTGGDYYKVLPACVGRPE